VRMYQTLLGRDGFRKGMDLYFERHDGQAVSCDDFRAAMADANRRDLSQFERWYSQAGTPRVKVQTRYDAEAHTYEVTLAQSCPATPGQDKKQPFHIPFAIGLLDAQGRDMPLHLETLQKQAPLSTPGGQTTCVLELTKARQTFRFTEVGEAPTPSLLRNFSAPVVLDYAYSEQQLAHLLAFDSDPFNRWEAGQRLAMQRLLALTATVQAAPEPAAAVLELDQPFIEAMRAVLNDATLDPAFRELVLTLPSEALLAEQCAIVDPHAIHAARRFMRTQLAQALKMDFLRAYEENLGRGKYSPDARSAGQRALKNLALSYLLDWADDSALQLAHLQETVADNMSDRLAALVGLVNSGSKSAAKPLQRFYKDFKKEALVVDKWFSLQATARTTDVAAVRKLIAHPAFTIANPNRARSLIFSFCNGNPAQFHAHDGSGYALWAEQVIALNALNPQVAARLARTLDRWKKYQPALRVQMQAALQKVAKSKKLSKDVAEVVSKALAV